MAERERPGWVRWAVGRRSDRPTAIRLLRVQAMNTAVMVLIVALSFSSESLVGRISLVAGLIGVLLLVPLCLWMWRAIRWMDRNGGWNTKLT